MIEVEIRFSEQQIGIILEQADDGIGVEDAGISHQTYYQRRKMQLKLSQPGCPSRRGYGRLLPSEMKMVRFCSKCARVSFNPHHRDRQGRAPMTPPEGSR